MKNMTPWWIRIPIIFFLIFGLMEYVIDSGDQPAFLAYPMAAVFLVFVLLLLIAIEVILASIENVLFQTLSDKAKERYVEDTSKPWEWAWGKRMYQKLLGVKPMEEEGEIILDHNYDGIRELDNKLPPWWVYLFYITIIFGVVYLVRFHIYNDYDQDEEYMEEMAIAEAEIAEYKKNAKGLVDANTVEVLTEKGDLAAGKALYETNCVACHMADGGGGIGPNLTDLNWILGGGIKNVFNTISEGGRDGKGMVAWKQSLKPLEMAQVASYVLTFQGTSPANPKAPEGEVWANPDMPSEQTPETDSLKVEVQIDSVTVSSVPAPVEIVE